MMRIGLRLARRTHHLAPVLTALAWLGSAGAALAADDASFAIRDVRVFDGKRTLPVANVVVRDGRIQAVAPQAPLPPGLPVIDGTGKTLLPGLIDSHVHVFPGAQADALRFGVTTELDMFDVQRDFAAWRKQREGHARTAEADTWAAGLGVTVPGGAPLQDAPPEMKLPTLTSAKEAGPFVAARVKEGSDYIKLFIEDLSEYGGDRHMPTLSPEELCAAITATHRQRRLAIVHVQAQALAREAIACHADGLAHLFPDSQADAAFVSEAKTHLKFILSTASVWAGASGLTRAKDLAADPRVAPLLSAFQKQTLEAAESKTVPAFFPTVLANIRALHAAGVMLLPGTDAPNPATAHGVSLHEELQIFVEAGYTPEQALQAATALPAAIFHLGDRGHVAPGYRADLVLVEGDPTRRITDTLSIATIWKNGYEVARTPPPAAGTP